MDSNGRQDLNGTLPQVIMVTVACSIFENAIDDKLTNLVETKHKSFRVEAKNVDNAKKQVEHIFETMKATCHATEDKSQSEEGRDPLAEREG